MQGTAAIGAASGSASAGLLFAVLRAVFQQGQLPDPCLTALPALAAIETETWLSWVHLPSLIVGVAIGSASDLFWISVGCFVRPLHKVLAA